jgi:hypothetical protein
MKGGRPPMAPNRLSCKRAMQLCADKESPLDVMFDNMLFWHRQSRDLGAKLDAICGKIKNEDDRREAAGGPSRARPHRSLHHQRQAAHRGTARGEPSSQK